MVNQTSVTEFILLGFSDIQSLQILHAAVFLALYLATLMGNVLIIVTVIRIHLLHTPMYFFLAILSTIDACYISTTVPKSIIGALRNNHLISISGCITQVFLVVTLASAELTLLTIMAYDRYVAICHPLRYMLIMNWTTCFQMAGASWACSIINGAIHTINTFSLHFCGANTIEQYFCDIPQLLKLSCSDTEAIEMFVFVGVLCVGFFCFLLVLVSYGHIFSAIFKIQSVQGRSKAFSTCTPHLTVFSLFVCTVMFSYMRPKALSSSTLDLVSAVLYTVLPPLMNPIIYSLRNKEIQMALQKLSRKRLEFHMVT